MGLEGAALFIDLDSVIVADVDPFFEFRDSDGVHVARNWVKPHLKAAQTSVFRFKIGTHNYMLDKLRADPVNLTHKYQFEQNYVTDGIERGVPSWPPEWNRHFRVHCLGPSPVRYLRSAKLLRGAKTVTFPGHPKPGNAIVGRWSPRHEPCTRMDQFRFAMSRSADFMKRMKRSFCRPIGSESSGAREPSRVSQVDPV